MTPPVPDAHAAPRLTPHVPLRPTPRWVAALTPRWAPAVVARRPVFLDETGRRWHWVRRGLQAVGAGIFGLTVFMVALAVIGPELGGLGDALMRAGRTPTAAAMPVRPQGAAQRAAERRLFASLHAPASLPAAGAPTAPAVSAPAGLVPATRPNLTAGFYVNWDDNARASLAQHARQLDWVVGEWAFVEPDGRLRADVDPRALAIVQRLPAAERPRLLAMVTNVDTRTRQFDPERVRRLVGTLEARGRAAAELQSLVRRYGLGGVTLDLENYPEALDGGVVALADTLRALLRPTGGVVALTVGTDQAPARARRLAAGADYAFLMLYDEHWATSTAGPVASQAWFTEQARALTTAVGPAKAVLALGAYGYGWNDANRDVEVLTHEEVMAAARAHQVLPRWDAAQGNPYLAWSDPDSTDHLVWYLDAATAHNQARVASSLGAAGVGVWRLGGEDPALWRVLGRGAPAPVGPAAAHALTELPPGYDVQFDGHGELLRVTQEPRAGRRTVTVDAATGFVTREEITELPTPYVVERTGPAAARRAGARPGRLVALTFDDGPDGQWTGPILDTLRAYRAPATFFVIGRQVQRHLALTRRIYAEGHELGNHTFTHPDLARTSPLATRLELDATNRVLEAALGRRTALFRPPYFGDAEPTTADALGPVRAATALGFVTAGLHVDAYDWRAGVRPADVVAAALRARDARAEDAHVVLLHDGGGDRASTLAAVGPLVDSLRARGDSLVLVSELVGVSREAAMPALPPSSAAGRWAALAAFGLAGAVDHGLTWLLTTAVVLGLARLLAVGVLAAASRRRVRDAAPDGAAGYAPAVTVLVPAYNEEKVVAKTVASLLQQAYAGPLEVVVVDDGSPDGTYSAAVAAFDAHPRVRVVRKPNGGKASALNHGLALARGEVIVALDADTVFLPDTVAQLVAPMADPRVGAVAGNAKVGNRVNLVTRWQAVEYVTSQNLDRRASELLDCITVVPGAVGAWRAAVVRAAGGFTHDTLAEDQDLTIAVRRRGHRVAYAERAVAYTEAPDTLAGLARQRFRWSFGTLQCMWKHRDALLRRRYGALGMVALPNVWLFQLLFTAVSPVADLMLLLSLAGVWVARAQHGGAYAAERLERVLLGALVFVLADWLAGVVAFRMEPGEDRRLAHLIPLQRFAYRQVMYWVVVRSFAAAVRGRVVGWGTLERKATVEAPTTPAASPA